jgi:hypothetical protein
MRSKSNKDSGVESGCLSAVQRLKANLKETQFQQRTKYKGKKTTQKNLLLAQGREHERQDFVLLFKSIL